MSNTLNPSQSENPDTHQPGAENDHIPEFDAEGDASAHVDRLMVAGEAFDPDKHALNADGTPRLKVDGTLAAKRGRKRAGAAPVNPSHLDPSQSQAPDPSLSNAALAKIIFGSVTGAMSRMVGPEWAPETPAEEKYMTGAIKAYFDAYGPVDISPAWGLLLAVGAYSAPRFAKENTRTKFQVAVRKAKSVYYYIRSKFGVM